MIDHDAPKLSAADRRNRNAYLREFVPAMTAYAVVLAAVLTLVGDDTPGRALWLLLPVVPLAGVAVAVHRSIQRSDEYSRLLQLEAMAAGFGAAMVASLAFGFLGIADIALAWSGWVVFGIGMVTWGLTLGLRGTD